MVAARMHGYKQPLVIEEVKIPETLPDEVLVRVGGAGMCRSNVQLVDGYFVEALKPKLPITPGHEIVWNLLTVSTGDISEVKLELA
jgi:alcohol dehydrogenase, propanol-preferring